MAKEKRNHEVITNGGNPVRFDTNIQRNDPCYCGSKKKYKNCCLRKRDLDTSLLVKDQGIKGVINMTKLEAIKALKKGFKITHDLFSKDEFVYLEPSYTITNKGLEGNILIDENGNKLNIREFFEIRTGPHWNIDWKLYDDFLKEGSDNV